MPRFDGTGPMGRGPRTGRGLGMCGRGRNRGVGNPSGGQSWFGRAFGGIGRRFSRFGRRNQGSGRNISGSDRGFGRGNSSQLGKF